MGLCPLHPPFFVAGRNKQTRKKLIHSVCVFLSSANKCLLKVGGYCAQLEQYQKAIEIYEQVCCIVVFFFKYTCCSFFFI